MGYTFTDARCTSTPIDFLKEGRDRFKKTLALFVVEHGITVRDFRIAQDKVDDISTRVYQRLNYYLFFHDKHLAQSRQAGIKAYWILRYRPLTLISSHSWKKKYDVNAYFAFFVILCEVLGECVSGKPRDIQVVVLNSVLRDYENVFIRALSEYDISKESMMLVSDGIKNMCMYELKLHA